ncbi:hypothetical protein BAUCODRAFT_144687 [Baudoinia panamericana UAMH 10762]|uniref:Glyoxalase-like domain-containing protein n=1 Tax=Baudoinia panamericana (strain UAMH 10762) TaxID=717646 RepID=M2MVW6_BAUPA|nr:uncharacterized protein BAUCODRAFT_144687 [Baudoinia panamericana UAMH 10762]EMD01122.1 hypothetical protein BAUCODRAFT_144687 [Baudoinia panamericana UAMH 10762]
MASRHVQLDHVIVLVPYAYLSNPPRWVTDNFVLSEGGRHTDNKTENRLVLFKDGTYLELIAFIDDDPARRKGHWWDKPYGVIDFAITSPVPFDYVAMAERLRQRNTGITYAEPAAGGRQRPDGVQLKWQVTFPEHVERGEVPFWCHDLTPRELRVPLTDTNTLHPCGATGMACVTVNLIEQERDRVRLTFPAIIDSSEREKNGFPVGTPGGLIDSGIQIEKLDGERPGMCLKLTLRCPPERVPQLDIHEKVGDGVILIEFVT